MTGDAKKNFEPSFYAHSIQGGNESTWQTLSAHLSSVGHLSGVRAEVFGARELATVSGRLHDLGKYTTPFQERLRGNPMRVDHSTWGARIAQQRFGSMGQLLAYGIAGHHAGLANGQGEGERTSLADRLKADLPPLHNAWERDIALPLQLAPPSFKHYGKSRQEAKERHQFQLSLLTRMLFSCLVDADFIDTERFYNAAEKKPDDRNEGPAQPALAELGVQLDKHLSRFKNDSDVNCVRAEILQHVRAKAVHPPGLFSLTVPTGGGKTLASLAFALDHAIRHGLRRVIFVIPFTSIVEQNAAVFREALGPLAYRRVPCGRVG